MMRTFLFLLLAATPSKNRYSLTQTGSTYSTDSLTLSADIELRFMTTRLGADVDAELQFSGIGKGSENK
jgi:hypothetical protein